MKEKARNLPYLVQDQNRAEKGKDTKTNPPTLQRRDKFDNRQSGKNQIRQYKFGATKNKKTWMKRKNRKYNSRKSIRINHNKTLNPQDNTASLNFVPVDSTVRANISGMKILLE